MTTDVFTKSIPDLQRWHAGERVSARKLNQSVEALNGIIRGVASPRQIRPVVRAKATEAVAGAVRRFTYTGTMGPDHLVCTDPVDESEVLVAKPWSLRQTPWDRVVRNGLFYEYMTTTQRRVRPSAGGNWETQVVIMRYVAQDVIYAITLAADEVDVVVSGTALTRLDTNYDARAWAQRFGV